MYFLFCSNMLLKTVSCVLCTLQEMDRGIEGGEDSDDSEGQSYSDTY